MTLRAPWAPFRRAGRRFAAIDGAQWAGSLAYSAFASLFPLILLFLTTASFFIAPDRAVRTVDGLIESYLPMSDRMLRLVFATISGMSASRGRAGTAASLVLVCSAGLCFGTFICATNRAWGADASDWRRLSLKSLLLLVLLAGAAPLGVWASMLARLTAEHFSAASYWIARAASSLLPMSMEFFGLSLFYRLAPGRSARFDDVWPAALTAALLLRAAEALFVIYLRVFSASNAVYGVFGGIIALLVWIYLCACIFIYGACLCAARGEFRAPRRFAVPPQ